MEYEEKKDASTASKKTSSSSKSSHKKSPKEMKEEKPKSPKTDSRTDSRKTSKKEKSSSSSSKSSSQKPPFQVQPEMKEKMHADFLQRYPGWQTKNAYFEKLIAEEYSHKGDLIYIDYTGASLYSQKQIDKYNQNLKSTLFGNPHSVHGPSQTSTESEHLARKEILEFFRADPAEYVVIFTNNASGACKLVGESFPFGPKRPLALLNDNHNSLVGIREIAFRAKAPVMVVYTEKETGLITQESLFDQLKAGECSTPGLFCYPAQSNWAGMKHDLSFVEGLQKKGWRVILDCAAFVPANRLDLSKIKPDFIPLSFYKMFGFPTGIGCLIAKKEALNELNKTWFSGGTVTVVSVNAKLYGHYANVDPRYWEDGTPNFLSTSAVRIGLQHLKEVGIENINLRVECLSQWVLEQASKLTFGNGYPLMAIYGTLDPSKRGGTITFNMFDYRKKTIPLAVVEKQSIKWNICLRFGCFCNPGAAEEFLGLHKIPYLICLGGRSLNGKIGPKDVIVCSRDDPVGAIRASFGIASRWEDAFVFLQFLSSFLNVEDLRDWKKEYRATKTIPDSLC